MKMRALLKGSVSFLLTLCLVLSMMPIGALAAELCTCTDKCSFSAPNSACAHCSSAEESAFRCYGTIASAVSAGNLTRTYGSSLEETFSLSITGGSGQLTIGYNKSHSVSTSGGTVSLRWADVLPGELNAGTYSLSYSFAPTSSDYRQTSGSLSFRVLPKELAASVQLSYSECVYDGVPKTPLVTATADGRTLTEGVDYTVRYSFNNTPGTAQAQLQDVPGDNYTVSGIGYFTILSAPSNIGAVTYTGPQLLDSMSPGDVVLTRQNTSVPGALTLSALKLSAGSHEYSWIFIPDDSGYEGANGTITLSVAHDWDKGSCTQAPSCLGCGVTDGTAPGHKLHYSVSGATVTETCSTPGFEHSGTVKLEMKSGVSTEYTGSAIEPLQLTYSDGWVGPRDLKIEYQNNTQIGTATGTVSVGGVTAKVTFQITPISMNVTAQDLTVTYNGQEHSASVTAPQGATVKYGTKSGSYDLSSCPAYKDAGTYTVYYQVTKENYKTVEGAFRIVIQPIALTVRADNAEKTYGEGEPTRFTWKITSGSLLAGESLTGITVSRDSGENVGNYAITPGQSSGANKNYKITFEKGTFSILQREITITWSGLELTYNGSEQAPKAAAGNTVGGDKLELTVSGGRKDATKGQKVTATVTGITGEKAANYKLPKNVTAQFEIKKATMEEPKIRYTDETVEGKKDGTILDVTSDMEYRREDQQNYTPITGTKIEGLAPGKYYVRYAESSNCAVSPAAEVVIGEGDKLKITLPKDQPGYTLTVDKAEVVYGGSAVLTFELEEGCKKTEDFAVKVNGKAVTLKPDGTCELKDIQEDLTVTVEGVSDAEGPTAVIRIGNRSWEDFLVGVRFKYYYNAFQTVTVTAEDAGSGVESIYYYLASYEHSLEQLKSVSNWKKYTDSFVIRPDNKYIVYVRVEDKTGNVRYFNTDGLVLDSTPPTINGVRNRGVYYTTQKVEGKDNFALSSFKVDGSNSTGTIGGNPSVETKHTLVAYDVAGNSATITITMMPISALGENLPKEEEMTLADMQSIQETLKKVQTILEKECKHATTQEKQALEDLEKRCLELLKKLEPAAEAAKLLNALPDSLTVEPDDMAVLKALDEAQAAYEALSDREKEMLGNATDRLDALHKAMTDYEITDGHNSKWTVGDSKGITIIANGYYDQLNAYTPNAYGKFLRVEVDGVALDSRNYTVRSGSTVVTLEPAYLETLESGKHTIRMVYTDGETDEATFRISQPILVNHSDNGLGIIGLLFWAALGLACLVGIVLVVLLILWRKEKE